MPHVLANAEGGDPNSANLIIVLVGSGIVVATLIPTFVLILAARVRRHPHEEVITVVLVFWALITAGSLIYAGNAQLSWSKQNAINLEAGYVDPQGDVAPEMPWGLWIGLGAVYAAMAAWTFSHKRGREQTR